MAAGKILAVIESAYRATLEEQDDTILWLTTAIKNAGADIAVLLRGNAVNYALQGQDASGLTIGGIPLKVPPTIDKDIQEMLAKGIAICAVEEDLKARGIAQRDLIQGVKVVPQRQVASLWDQYDSVWHW